MKKFMTVLACCLAILSSHAGAAGLFLDSLAEAKSACLTKPAKHVLVYYGNYRG